MAAYSKPQKWSSWRQTSGVGVTADPVHVALHIVSGKTNNPNVCHSRGEVTAAGGMLKGKNLADRFTVEDLEYITHLRTRSEKETDPDDVADWAEDVEGSGTHEEEIMTYMADHDVTTIEAKL